MEKIDLILHGERWHTISITAVLQLIHTLILCVWECFAFLGWKCEGESFHTLVWEFNNPNQLTFAAHVLHLCSCEPVGVHV